MTTTTNENDMSSDEKEDADHIVKLSRKKCNFDTSLSSIEGTEGDNIFYQGNPKKRKTISSVSGMPNTNGEGSKRKDFSTWEITSARKEIYKEFAACYEKKYNGEKFVSLEKLSQMFSTDAQGNARVRLGTSEEQGCGSCDEMRGAAFQEYSWKKDENTIAENVSLKNNLTIRNNFSKQATQENTADFRNESTKRNSREQGSSSEASSSGERVNEDEILTEPAKVGTMMEKNPKEIPRSIDGSLTDDVEDGLVSERVKIYTNDAEIDLAQELSDLGLEKMRKKDQLSEEPAAMQTSRQFAEVKVDSLAEEDMATRQNTDNVRRRSKKTGKFLKKSSVKKKSTANEGKSEQQSDPKPSFKMPHLNGKEDDQMEVDEEDNIDMDIITKFSYIKESELLSFVTVSGERVTIIDVITDTESNEDKCWKYQNAMKVSISYRIQGESETRNVRLDHLLSRKTYPKCRNDTLKEIDINEVKELISKNFPTAEIIEFQTDMSDLYTSENSIYKDSSRCFVVYKISNELKRIRLDNLMKREIRESPNLLLKSDLENGLRRCCPNLISYEFRSDVKNDECESTSFFEYRNSAQCNIVYVKEENGPPFSVRLNNFLQRGITNESQLKYKFYSWQMFAKISKNKGLDESFLKGSENEFLKTLQEINQYYIQHPDYATHQGIEPRKGPQNFQDRVRENMFFYCGRGDFKFYRYQDLIERIEKKFGQTHKEEFMANHMLRKINDDDFMEIVKDVHYNIVNNHGKHHDKFVPYAGPQIPYHRTIGERVQYHVRYKKENSKVDPGELTETDEEDEEDEEYNKSYRFRKCDICHKHRLLDKMARKKHRAGYFTFEGENVRIQFTCDMLYRTECSDKDDVNQEVDVIDSDCTYVMANKNVVNFSPLEYEFIVARFTLVEGNTNVYFRKELANINFANKYDKSEVDKYTHVQIKIRNGIATATYGSIGGKNRFFSVKEKEFKDWPVWKVVRTKAREALCVVPWLDRLKSSEDPFHFSIERMVRIYNAYLCMNMMKILECKKCGRTTVGLEDKNAAKSISTEIEDFIRHSEVLNCKTSIDIDYERFKNKDVHESTPTSCRSICTDCSQKYHDNGKPKYNVSRRTVLSKDLHDTNSPFESNASR